MSDELLREFIELALFEAGDAGCRYESQVIKSLKLAGATGHLKRAACSDPTRPDADMRVDNEIYYVEVKMDANARMGGGSVGYSLKDRKFFPTGRDRSLSEAIVAALNGMGDTSLNKSLKTFLQTLSRESGKTFTGLPLSGFTTGAWEFARDMGLLQAINRSFDSDLSIIADHYAKKDTHYIQIGGSGFFHLGSNPANLPVPKLEGKVRVEVLLALAGVTWGEDQRAAGMRAWARLKISNQSPYTLDDPQSIEAMLKAHHRPRKK